MPFASIFESPKDIRSLAQLLSYCLRTERLSAICIWNRDLPNLLNPDSTPAIREVVLEALLRDLEGVGTETEMRRFLETLWPNPSGEFSRSWLISQISSRYLTFAGYEPRVKLNRYRKWRSVCHFGDEDVYVACAAGELLGNVVTDLSRASMASLWRIALKVCSNWALRITPLDAEVGSFSLQANHDTHIHFGQLLPSNVFWNLLMQGHYQPYRNAESSPLSLDGSARTTCGPAWIAAECESWKERRAKLIQALQERQVPWLSEVRAARFLELGSALDPTWEDASCSSLPFILRFVCAERMLLIIGYIIAKRDPDVDQAFWSYVAVRATFFASHIPKKGGFESFHRTERFDHIDGYRWGSGGEIVWYQLAASWIQSLRLKSLDIRLKYAFPAQNQEVRSKLIENVRRSMDPLATAWNMLFDRRTCIECTINIVISFSKTSGGRFGNAYGVRSSSWRDLRQALQNFAKAWLAGAGGIEDGEDGQLKWRVSAVDMISNEFGFDAGIIASSFRSVRREFNIHEADRFRDDVLTPLWNTGISTFPGPPSLRRFYHVGENYEHAVTSLRSIHEAVTWLDLEAVDRIGHASVLSELPRSYSVYERLGERLDNFTCLAALTNKPQWKSECEAGIQEVFRNFGIELTIADLIEGWSIRHFNEQDIVRHFANRRSVVTAYLSFSGISEPSEYSAALLQISNTDRGLLEQCIAARSVPVNGMYASEAWEDLRQFVSDEIKQRGVAIETCPSSNLTIGSFWEAIVPAIGLISLNLGSQLTLGSDDPQMLKTDIHVEAGLLANDILVHFGTREAVRSHVSQVLFNDSSFEDP